MSKSKQIENELRKKFIKVGKDILKISADKNFTYEQALMKAERSLLMLYTEGLKTGFEHIESHLNQVIELLDEVHSGKQQTTYLTTGLLDLDEMLCGLDAGKLYIIGGSPGMGKTALALTILRHAAVVEKVAIGFFSMDLSGTQIAFRLLCLEAKVDTHLVRTGKLAKSKWKAFTSSMATLGETSIFIDDTISLSSLKMKHNAIRLKAEHDIQLLIIDNNQAIQKRNTQHLPCRLLKQMAVELDIPVIVTFPLTREPEERINKRPLLSDFHHAVEIEESADTIMLLYRPRVDTLAEADRALAEVIIAKNRNGPTGVVNMRFVEKHAVFE